MPKYIQLVYFGHIMMQLINGAFQFASVDIRMGQISMFYDCFHGYSRNQFEVRSI